MKTSFLFILALGIASQALAQTPTVPDRFKQIDKNSDGTLSRIEVTDAAAFTAADTDKDGAVTVEEYRRYVANRPKTNTPAPAKPGAVAAAPAPAPVNGRPVLKQLPDSDAVRDAAGTGQLFECVHVPGLTDVRAGMNGFAVADLNGDGFKDVLVCEDPTLRAFGRGGDRLRLMLGQGGFVFIEHPIRIAGSTITAAATKRSLQVPNLVDLNGDGFLDIFVTCSSAYNQGKRNPRAPADVGQGNLLLLSQGTFDSFADFTTRLGTANDRAYNRQSSFGDVNCQVDVREPGLPLWPGEYRQGVFCWKNLLVETGETRFEKVTGNGLHAEAALRFDWKRKLYEPATDARAPGLPYVALADVDHDGDQDVFATGPSDVSWSPRVEYVGGRFWRNEGGFRFTEFTTAAASARSTTPTGSGSPSSTKPSNRGRRTGSPAPEVRSPRLGSNPSTRWRNVPTTPTRSLPTLTTTAGRTHTFTGIEADQTRRLTLGNK